VELVACAAVLVLTAVAALAVLSAVRARIAAERIADQAAVLLAEHRPLPPALHEGAEIRRDGNRVVVIVALRMAVPGLPASESAVAVLPE
jgi:hypothetical protein